MDIKSFSWNLKNQLKTQNVDIPITKVLEMVSQSLNFKNYNTAKSRVTEIYAQPEEIEEDGMCQEVGDGKQNFDVSLQVPAVLTVSMQVKANSFKDAIETAYEYYDANTNCFRDVAESFGFEYLLGERSITDISNDEEYMHNHISWSAYTLHDDDEITAENLDNCVKHKVRD